MFSGIVETIGLILNLQQKDSCHYLQIQPNIPFSDLKIGDSVSVNGVCLTVTDFSESTFSVTVVPETLNLTNLKNLNIGDNVNLERSLKINDRIGGHYVQGHVDNQGQIIEIENNHSVALVKISLPPKLAKYVVNKGFITLDGMSITVIQSTSSWFSITLIPHTLTATIAHQYTIGTWINIETDIIAKYVEKLSGVYAHDAIPH